MVPGEKESCSAFAPSGLREPARSCGARTHTGYLCPQLINFDAAMTDAKLPILYDLVCKKGVQAPFYSPHCCKARLALVHKRVQFETREVDYNDTRGKLSARLGVKKATGECFAVRGNAQGAIGLRRWMVADSRWTFATACYPHLPQQPRSSSYRTAP